MPKFREMLRNMIKRQKAARVKRYEMKPQVSLKLQMRLLAVALGFVLLVMLTGCSGNYKYGDTMKIYCQPVEGYDVEKYRVTSDEATIEY